VGTIRSSGVRPLWSLPVRLFGAALLMGIDCQPGPTGPPELPTCECYSESQCHPNLVCGINGCVHQGKNDGECVRLPGGGTDVPTELSPANRAAETIDLVFRAYEPAVIAEDGGRADPVLWDRMYETALSPRWAEILIYMSHLAIDRTLGFDFAFVDPTSGIEDTRGNFRGSPHGALALLRATRDALIAGVLARDPAAVRGPIANFWRMRPAYVPDHTGRCYPHGHHQLENVDPETCQRDYLQRAVQQIIPHLTP
jgi:hypothetical protein